VQKEPHIELTVQSPGLNLALTLIIYAVTAYDITIKCTFSMLLWSSTPDSDKCFFNSLLKGIFNQACCRKDTWNACRAMKTQLESVSIGY